MDGYVNYGHGSELVFETGKESFDSLMKANGIQEVGNYVILIDKK